MLRPTVASELAIGNYRTNQPGQQAGRPSASHCCSHPAWSRRYELQTVVAQCRPWPAAAWLAMAMPALGPSPFSVQPLLLSVQLGWARPPLTSNALERMCQQKLCGLEWSALVSPPTRY